jgi:hypothetical protein
VSAPLLARARMAASTLNFAHLISDASFELLV